MELIRFTLLGVATGGGYALAALGIVLIYRGAGVLNFAHGAIGMVSAFAYYELTRDLGWASPVAAVVALTVGAALSGLIHLLVMRFLAGSAHLTRMVATLGLLIFVQELGLRRWGVVPRVVEPLLPNQSFTIVGLHIGSDRLLVLLLAVVATAVLATVYRRTRFGLATTAVAEDERSASLLGWSPNTIAMVNWVLAGGLAAAAAICLAQLSTLTVEGASLMVLPALAAALVGRFRSFWGTLGGAVTIGVFQALLARYSQVPGLSESVPLIVIVVVLMARGRALPSRGESRAREPRLGLGVSALPMPVLVALAVVSIGAVLLLPDRFAVGVSLSSGYGLIILSVVVLTGYTGQLSLAQFTLGGVGALLAGRLVAEAGWPFLPSILVAMAAAAALGVLIALPALRTRGMTLAMATLGLAVVLEQMLLGNFDLNGGFSGIPVGDISVLGLEVGGLRHPQRFGALALLMLVATMAMTANMRRGAAGRRSIAVRSNERSAAALGIDVTDTKLMAFALAAALAALGGILVGFHSARVSPTQFTILESINVVTLAVIGGLGYVSGGLIAALASPGGFLQPLLHGWGNLGSWLYLASGLGVVIIVLWVPDGLAKHYADQVEHLRRRLRRAGAAPPVLADADEPTSVPPRTLEVRDLTVRFGGVTAVDGASLIARPGTVTGLIGPNGAGKTTLLDAISGFVSPSSGQVLLDGDAIEGLRPSRRADRGLGRSFQSVELFDDLTVYDNLRVACDPRRRSAYLRDLVRPRDRGLTGPAVAAVEEFGLQPVLQRFPRELPFGQRRLVGIARAVAQEPSVLLLDEPAAGLDDTETEELGGLITRLARTWGMTVVLVEHDVGLVFRICDDLTVLEGGAVLARGAPDELAHDSDVVAAYLGAPVAATTESASEGGERSS